MESTNSVVFTEEAVIEIEELRDFYESRKLGLGFDFLEDILLCIDIIESNPRLFQFAMTAEEGIRRGLSDRFSIVILYHVRGDMIEILTVADSRSNWA